MLAIDRHLAKKMALETVKTPEPFIKPRTETWHCTHAPGKGKIRCVDSEVNCFFWDRSTFFVCNAQKIAEEHERLRKYRYLLKIYQNHLFPRKVLHCKAFSNPPNQILRNHHKVRAVKLPPIKWATPRLTLQVRSCACHPSSCCPFSRSTNSASIELNNPNTIYRMPENR